MRYKGLVFFVLSFLGFGSYSSASDSSIVVCLNDLFHRSSPNQHEVVQGSQVFASASHKVLASGRLQVQESQAETYLDSSARTTDGYHLIQAKQAYLNIIDFILQKVSLPSAIRLTNLVLESSRIVDIPNLISILESEASQLYVAALTLNLKSDAIDEVLSKLDQVVHLNPNLWAQIQSEIRLRQQQLELKLKIKQESFSSAQNSSIEVVPPNGESRLLRALKYTKFDEVIEILKSPLLTTRYLNLRINDKRYVFLFDRNGREATPNRDLKLKFNINAISAGDYFNKLEIIIEDPDLREIYFELLGLDDSEFEKIKEMIELAKAKGVLNSLELSKLDGEIILAARKYHYREEVLRLYNLGANVDGSTAGGLTPLHLMPRFRTQSEADQYISLFISLGASTESIVDDHVPKPMGLDNFSDFYISNTWALKGAIRSRDIFMFRGLLNAGAKYKDDETTNRWDSGFLLCLLEGFQEGSIELIRRGLDKKEMNGIFFDESPRLPYDTTPFFFALEHNQFDVASRLVQTGGVYADYYKETGDKDGQEIEKSIRRNFIRRNLTNVDQVDPKLRDLIRLYLRLRKLNLRTR